MYYTVYKSPLNADDVFYEESFKDQEINVVQQDRYNVEVLEKTTDIKIKDDRMHMEELKDFDPYLYVQPKQEEDEGECKEQQELIVNVRGMEKFAYEIENNTVTAQVEKAEKQKVDAKVVLRGEPKEEVVGVEVLDDEIGRAHV